MGNRMMQSVQWGTLMMKKACSKLILDFQYSNNAYNIPEYNLGTLAHLLRYVLLASSFPFLNISLISCTFDTICYKCFSHSAPHDTSACLSSSIDLANRYGTYKSFSLPYRIPQYCLDSTELVCSLAIVKMYITVEYTFTLLLCH